MSKTYIFAEKNGCAVITLSEESEDEAIKYLEGIVREPMGWRLTEVEEEERE